MQTAAIGLVTTGAILSGLAIASPANAQTPAPTPFECSRNYELSDEAAFARAVLSERSNDLVFSQQEWDSTVAGAANALARVREAQPLAQELFPLDRYRRIVTLEVRGPFADQFLTGPDQGTLIVDKTGEPALDAIIERLDVRTTRILFNKQFRLVVVELCLGPLANSRASVTELEKLPFVFDATDADTHPHIYLDGPGLEMRLRDGTWFVVVREASGDCPSGCIRVKHWFYRVTGAAVEPVAEADALTDPLFTALLDRVEIRNPPWPAVTTPIAITPTPAPPSLAPGTPAQLPVAGGAARPGNIGWVLVFAGFVLVSASGLGFAVARRR